MDLSTFLARYIRQTIAYPTHYKITKDDYNSNLNLLITQGDYNSEALQTAAAELVTLRQALLSSDIKYLRINSNRVLEVSQDGNTWVTTSSDASPYAAAVAGGYTGTEAQFMADLADVSTKASTTTTINNKPLGNGVVLTLDDILTAAERASLLTKNIYTAVITTAWLGASAPYTQEIFVEGILDTDIPEITPVYSEVLSTAILEKEAWNKISKGETSTDKITLTCFEEKPTHAINIKIKVVR